jgi:hypothetical protein
MCLCVDLNGFFRLQMAANAALIQNREPLLGHCIAAMDGLNLPVRESGDPLIQNANYNGYVASVTDSVFFLTSFEPLFCFRGSYTSCCNVSNVFVFDPNGLIIFAVLNKPGSWHDATVAEDLFRRVDGGQYKIPAGHFIVTDSAFPVAGRSWLVKALAPAGLEKELARVTAELGARTAEGVAARRAMVKTRAALGSIRLLAEWGNRCLQGAFGRLQVPLPAEPDTRLKILSVIVHVHNLKARTCPTNQIRTVFAPGYSARIDPPVLRPSAFVNPLVLA